MSKPKLTRREILKQIETGELSSADGLRLIQQTIQERKPLEPSLTEENASCLMYLRGEWERKEISSETSAQAAGNILVFDFDKKVCERLKRQLENGTQSRVMLVKAGEGYSRLHADEFQINPESKDDFRRLFEVLQTEGTIPKQFIHLWSLTSGDFAEDKLGRDLSQGIFSSFLCCQALLELKVKSPVDYLYIYRGDEKNIQPQHAGLSGFARTLRREHPNFLIRTIALDPATEAAAIALREMVGGYDAVEVSYRQNQRHIKRLRSVDLPAVVPQQAVLRQNGVYVITGGAGGLGLKFAEHIAGQVKARLVLACRSELSAKQASQIEQLKASGAEVLYCQVDVSKREDVERLISETKTRFNALHGIIHAAGVIRDALVLKKSRDDMAAVLAPKVYGSVWLDHVTRDEQLDFLVLFSSVAAIFGSVGQSDYGYANGFMDSFAEWRNVQCKERKRFGKTLAINWPLWLDGGMTVDSGTQILMQKSGVELLGAEQGMRAFSDALASTASQHVVLYGKRGSLEELVEMNDQSVAELRQPKTIISGQDIAALTTKTEARLKEILAKEAKLPLSKIRSHEPLENLGIDSPLIMSLTHELEKLFGELPKTLFFEYQTLAELTGYFVEHHREVLQRMFGAVSQTPAAESKPSSAKPENTRPGINRLTQLPATDPKAPASHDDIAIIGLSGRYPMADDLVQFWNNLKQGRDCITEVPPDRWNHSQYFDTNKKKLGKSYSKWGGFINDVDKFDPLFFNISPAEAALIDPQERLFLETVWQTIEDAGYTREQLNASRPGVFVGVMYGQYQLFSAESSLKGNGLVFGSSFASIANRVSYVFNFKGPSIAIDTMCSSSLTAIHFACRSIWLRECDVAIAGGVNVSIHPQKYLLLSQGRFAASDGRCRSFGEGGDGYVPGEGVGAVLLKPLAQAIADRDQIYGVIKGSSINHGGKTNGYTVPNPKAQQELITEALRSAKLDSARISYIEAHGTGTSLGDPIEITSLTKAFRTSATDEGKVGLTTNHCPIGSVKSNIGHLESAAGIAALTKVLLQFKHRQLVPSLHAKRLNPNLNLSESPFFIQQDLAEWKQPVTIQEGEEKPQSRQAGISGFGAGGANAHVIVEEYLDDNVQVEDSNGQPQIIVISAKTAERLRDYATRYLHFLNGTKVDRAALDDTDRKELVVNIQKDLLTLAAELVNVTEEEIDVDESLSEFGFDWVNLSKLAEQIAQKYSCVITPTIFSEQSSIGAIARYVSENFPADPANSFQVDAEKDAGAEVSVNLADLAYTLQVGREAMRERLALVVSSQRELCEKLQRYLDGDTEDEHLHTGSFVPGNSTSERVVEGRAGKEFIKLLIDDCEWNKLAQLWVSGVEINWPELHNQTRVGHRLPRRISVPTYPFARERYWVPEPQRSTAPLTRLHPLIDRNISTLNEISFATHLSCDEPCLLDQGNGRFMPELAIIEMARAAAELAQDRAVARINNIRWGLPVVAPENVLDLRVSLLPNGDAVEFEVSSNVEPHGLIAHGQGVLVYEDGPESKQINELVDIEAVKSRCPDTRSSEQCYEYLRGVGLNYSQEQRVVRELFFDDDDALVCFDLSPEETTGFFLNPLMLDGLMQAAAIWLPAIGQPSGQLRPSSLNEIDLKRPLARAAYAYLKLASNQGVAESQEKELTVRFVDAAGQVLVKLTALALKVQQTQTHTVPAKPVLVAPTNGTSVRPQLESHLQKMAAELIKIAPEQLEVNSGLGDFGFESVTFVELADQLSQLLEVEVAPTVFFECDTIRGLSNYLLKEFGERVKSLFTNAHTATDAGETVVAHAETSDRSESLVPLVRQGNKQGARRNSMVGSLGQNREAIAVIGMSGVFPGSKDLNQFWENVRDEKDLITEIPADRWNWRDYHADFSNGQFKTQAKWGGFIEDADKFDARFFNISPLEAEMMDPQQRVFLETVWKAIEDGGYKASEFEGRRVGLFVGVQFSDYQQMLASQGLLNAQMGLGNEHSILVNRISYLLNLRGPSEPYNTACSSALVAVHRAVNSIRSGEAELAIAGGISLMLSPFTTISGDSLGVLSVDGRCKTLDTSANGYVRGEGAGALLLKPLERALADNDNIYAVIKGTAVNHGGKASSLTAPNSDAQAALLVQAYEEADVDPESVSYLELHGTGTKLGDPIEIEGIKKAFKQLGERRQKKQRRTQYCGIGSVKTNIGHLEPASGIAGMMKLILSMKHKTLPALLHLKELNPYVKLQETPFYIVDQTRDWQQLRDGNEQLLPRRAGVSSFGFGGVNAHVVLQEFEPSPSSTEVNPQLIVLSAKNDDRLRAYVENLLGFLNSDLQTGASESLADVAYTLQVGREEFAERLAVIASSKTELRDKLSVYLETGPAVSSIYRGKVKGKKTDEVTEAEQERINNFITARDLQRLAEQWVSGDVINWLQLHLDNRPHRISLPTYPFERKRYWALKSGASLVSIAPAAKVESSKPVLVELSEDDQADDIVLEELKRIFSEELKTDLDGMELETDFTEFGVDSILASVIIQRIRERFGDAITFSAIIEYPTLRELTAYIKEEAQPEEIAPVRKAGSVRQRLVSASARPTPQLPPELVPLNLKGDQQPSFWVHGGVGYAALYSNLSKALGPDYPFYAFQARGVDGKTIPHDFEEMIAHYTNCIRLAQPAGPYVVGGYSYGGLVAYEIARRMHLEGDKISRLVLFDTLPSVEEAFNIFLGQYGSDDDFLTMMMGNEFAGSKKAGRPLVTVADIENVPPKLRLDRVAKLAKERGQTAMSADEIANYIRGSIKLCDYTEATYRTYRAEPYEGSDVLYFQAQRFLSNENWIGTEAHDIFRHYDYIEPWRQLVKGEVSVVRLQCDHFNMLEEPALSTSVEHVRAALRSQADEAPQSRVA